MKIYHGFIPQAGPQHAYITCPCDVVVYGGARGGGKTHGSLGEFWLHAQDYLSDAKGLMVRKSREDLKDTIDIASSMYGNAAVWNEQKKFFKFRGGATLHMAYLENDADAMNYQGWSLTRVYVEEITQYASNKGIFKLFATLRSATGIRPQFRATCNPGGPGHHWVKQWAIDLGPMRPFKDPDTGLVRVFIPAKLTDNPALLKADPHYVNRLRASGSPELVRAWLEGDWNVIEGAFFPEFETARHVIPPIVLPHWWTRFRSMDWGSARPFSVGWWTVVQDDFTLGDRTLPRGAIVRYREWYGAASPNIGLKWPAEKVARGIAERDGHDDIAYGVLDPASFAVISGPSIGEVMARHNVPFRPADNSRKSIPKRMGGWDQLRARLRGDPEGRAMIFFTEPCKAIIRTLPMMQHNEHDMEDLDTDSEDHAVDETRYACMSRPYTAILPVTQDLNPYRISNIFKLKDYA